MQEDKEIQEYLKVCEIRQKTLLKDFQKKVEQAQKKVDSLSKEIILTIRAKQDAEFQVKIYEKAISENRQKYIDEFNSLKGLACYEYINLIETEAGVAFSGKTKKIEIEHKNKKYDFGCYTVTIQNGKITISKEGCSDSIIHPHVYNGSPCLGDAAESIPKLIANFEYVIVFDMLYKYLCSYNESSPYKKIELFEGVRK